MDFIHDQLSNGRGFRCLTLIDQFTCQCHAISVEHSIGGINVVETLKQLRTQKGLLKTITLDNGPEFTSKALHLWVQNVGVSLHHIQPGKPIQNAYIESFNGKLRNECLNQHWFSNLAEAKLLIEQWRNHYNQLRPHSSIGGIPPDLFAKKSFNP